MDAKQQFKSDVRAILDEELVTPVRETALALARALAQDLAALHDLLTGAVPLLELAAKMAAEGRCSECPVRDECNPHLDEGWRTDHWLCNTIPAALRELAQGLRAVVGEEEG